MEKKTRKNLQIAAFIIIGIVVIALGFSFWLSYHYKETIKAELPQRVKDATHGVYTAHIDDLDFNILTMSAGGSGMMLYPDTQYLQKTPVRNLYSIKIPSVRIRGINLFALVFSKKLKCSRLIIDEPEISITQNKDIQDSLWKNPDKPGEIKLLSIGKVLVKDAIVNFHSVADSDTVSIQVAKANAELDDWEYYPNQKEKNTGFLFAEDGAIKITDLEEYKIGEPYKTKADEIAFNSRDRKATVTNLTILPTMDSNAFNKANGHQKDYFRFRFPEIIVTGIRWEEAISSEKLITDSVFVNNMSITDYLDRRMPETGESKIGNYPHQLIKKLPVPLYVKQLKINESSISYTEFNPKTDMAGKLTFGNVKGTISNITNIPDSIAKDPKTVADMYSTLNGGGNIHAVFTFNLGNSNGTFNVDATIQDIMSKQLYQPFVALGKVALKSFNMKRTDATISGTDMQATGHVKMIYSDLKVSVQKKDDEKNKLESRWLISLLANKILLIENNPEEGEEIRTADVQTDRAANRSFFNLIWQTLLQGITETVMVNEELADAATKK